MTDSEWRLCSFGAAEAVPEPALPHNRGGACGPRNGEEEMSQRCMAVRAALRVELALRAGDTPAAREKPA